MLNILNVFLMVFFIQKTYAVSFTKPCRVDDKDCIITSSQQLVPDLTRGIPEYGIDSIDPIYLEKEKSDEPDLKVNYDNFIIVGANRTKIIDIIPDASSNTVTVVADIPVRFYGHYNTVGKIMGMDVHGDGPFDINTGIVRFYVNASIKTFKGKGGKDHWEITGSNYKYDLTEKVEFRIENLYGGNNEMAISFHDLLHVNYKDIVDTFGSPFLGKMIKECVGNVNKLLSFVPCEDFIIA